MTPVALARRRCPSSSTHVRTLTGAAYAPFANAHKTLLRRSLSQAGFFPLTAPRHLYRHRPGVWNGGGDLRRCYRRAYKSHLYRTTGVNHPDGFCWRAISSMWPMPKRRPWGLMMQRRERPSTLDFITSGLSEPARMASPAAFFSSGRRSRHSPGSIMQPRAR